MKNKKLYKAFIIAFLFLYVIIACISFVHSIGFFSIGNSYWMSVLLGFSFELGQAVVLASILLSENKKSLLTWIIFIILTAVQCIGNVYSVYKFMSLSNVEYYKFLQEPLLFWIQGVDQQMVKVIVSWITGALLPIVALGMTGMVASNIQLMNSVKKEESDKEITNEDVIENKDILPDPIIQSEPAKKVDASVFNPIPEEKIEKIVQDNNKEEKTEIPMQTPKPEQKTNLSKMIFKPFKK